MSIVNVWKEFVVVLKTPCWLANRFLTLTFNESASHKNTNNWINSLAEWNWLRFCANCKWKRFINKVKRRLVPLYEPSSSDALIRLVCFLFFFCRLIELFAKLHSRKVQSETENTVEKCHRYRISNSWPKWLSLKLLRQSDGIPFKRHRWSYSPIYYTSILRNWRAKHNATPSYVSASVLLWLSAVHCKSKEFRWIDVDDDFFLDGRTEPNLDDIALAFNDLNINVADLEEYISNVDSVPCIINVPKFPIPKESNLNFLKPGSKEVVTRPVHIHEHLPPIQPHEGNSLESNFLCYHCDACCLLSF